jgi:hypothetical protein
VDAKKEVGEGNYDEHVEALAQRLHEASVVARKQSKLSHQTAKRHYDRQAKDEQFQRGDLVYLYDPVHKRGKVQKFSYQYQGPFKIEARILPLIYKLCVDNGQAVIVHINRLKRAYSNVKIEPELSGTPRKKSSRGQQQSAKLPMLEQNDIEVDTNVPTCKTNVIVEIQSPREYDWIESPNSSPLRQDRESPEWTPDSRYQRRKLLTADIMPSTTYQLRSRPTPRQEPETEVNLAGDDLSFPVDPEVDIEPQPSLSTDAADSVNEPPTHPYNLRSLVRST